MKPPATRGDRMRKNNHNNRRKTAAGATDPSARTEGPVYTAKQRETMQQGLRILARIIARAHLKRQSSLPESAPSPEPRDGD